MTDDDKPNDDGQIDFAPPDLLLQFLVTMVNGDANATLGVTLTVPGGVVSGQLIQNERWLREVGQVITDVTGTTDGFAEVVRDWNSIISRLGKEDGDGDGNMDADSSTLLVGHVHLADAHFYLGGDIIPTGDDGVHWRGRLRDVSGWNLGVLGSSQPA